MKDNFTLIGLKTKSINKTLSRKINYNTNKDFNIITARNKGPINNPKFSIFNRDINQITIKVIWHSLMLRNFKKISVQLKLDSPVLHLSIIKRNNSLN